MQFIRQCIAVIVQVISKMIASAASKVCVGSNHGLFEHAIHDAGLVARVLAMDRRISETAIRFVGVRTSGPCSRVAKYHHGQSGLRYKRSPVLSTCSHRYVDEQLA